MFINNFFINKQESVMSEITIKKTGIQKNKLVICFEGEEFRTIEELAEYIVENCDNVEENCIKLSNSEPTISQEQFKKLMVLVKDLLRDSLKEYYEEVTNYD